MVLNTLYYLLLLTTSFCIMCAAVIFFSENTMYSVFSLVITIIFSSIALILLGIEFLALAYILIYAGAVVVLFLFVILSTDLRREDMWSNKQRLAQYKVSILFVFIFCLLFIVIFFNVTYVNNNFFVFSQKNLYTIEFLLNDIFIFSKLFYTQYFILFILLGILLFTVLVGSISLCLEISKKEVDV